MPGGIGIDFSDYGCNGAATADGDAQIVYGVFIGGAMQGIQFPYDALHPIGETPMLRRSPGNGSGSSHASLVDPFGTAVGCGPDRTEPDSLSLCISAVQWGCGKLKWRSGEPRAIFLKGPEWRNWQTQQTQNLPELCSVWVRLPPPGPTFPAKTQKTALTVLSFKFVLTPKGVRSTRSLGYINLGLSLPY